MWGMWGISQYVEFGECDAWYLMVPEAVEGACGRSELAGVWGISQLVNA